MTDAGRPSPEFKEYVLKELQNLLELQDIREVMEHIKTEINPENTGKEKAAAAAGYFQAAADRKGVVLKLRKKPSTPSGQKQKDTE